MIEHPATLEPCRHLTKLGVTVTYVPVDGTGLVDPGDVSRAITRDTNLISIAAPRHRVRLDAMARLYLDYNASTPIDPEVVDVMRPLLVSDYGNP